MQERLLSVKDVAKRLSVSERWVAAELRSGRMKGVHLAKKWRVTEDQLEDFVKGRVLVSG